MWFAFKMYLWLIDIHSGLAFKPSLRGCDLLSKCIFDLLIFTLDCCRYSIETVVICFQNVSLTYWYSLNAANNAMSDMLWFAFKMYLWLIDIHLFHLVKVLVRCCDLLSKCIFDLLIFTLHWIRCVCNSVVICFQNVSLTYWYSLGRNKQTDQIWLWFAFKMYLWLIDIHLHNAITNL